MTTITIPTTQFGNVKIEDPSSELLDRILGSINVAPVVCQTQEITREVISKTAPSRVASKPSKANNGERMLACGHTQAISGAGRPPQKCDSCKAGKNKAREQDSEVADSTTEQVRLNHAKRFGGGRKNSSKKNGKRDFKSWLAEHGDEPMTPGMEKSIRWMLTNRKVTARNSKRISALLDRDPRMTCNEASEEIGKLHDMPKA